MNVKKKDREDLLFISEDGEFYDVKEKINNEELVENLGGGFLRTYYNLIKIKNPYDLFQEEDFQKFKKKVVKAFKNNLIFPQKEKAVIKELYLDKLEPCEDIKSLCRTLLQLYTIGGSYRKELLLYYVVNVNLKTFQDTKIKMMKHLLIGLLLNFNKEFAKNLKTINTTYRLTNFADGILKKGEQYYSNQFL